MTFRTVVNYQNHDINKYNLSIAGTDKVPGLHSFEIETLEDATTVTHSNSGAGIANDIPITGVTFKLTILAGDEANTVLWQKWTDRAKFSLDLSCSIIDGFKCSAKFCNIMKQPTVTIEKEQQMIEWTFIAVSHEYKSGGHKVETE